MFDYTDLYQFFWRFTSWRRGWDSPFILKQLENSQWSDPSSIRDLQWNKLQSFLNHAYTSVPYYRQLFDDLRISPRDIRSWNDFTRIPPLTRATLQNNFEQLHSTLPGCRLRTDASGGSTGNPVVFTHDDRYWEVAEALKVRFWQWCGARPGDRIAFLWGADRDIPEHSLWERLQLWMCRERWLNSFRMSDQTMEDFRKKIVAWKPHLVRGYASSLAIFSRWALEENRSLPVPRAVLSSAEVLQDEDRTVVEKAFNAPVFNDYGSREVTCMAVECPEAHQLHINAEYRIIEVNAPCSAAGAILVTDLTSWAMPFIRYENGDWGSLSEKRCSCRRGLPYLKKLEGRASDFLVTRQNVKVHGEFFTHLMYGEKSIRQFQVVQAIDYSVSLKIVPSGKGEVPINRLKEKFSQQLGSDISILAEIVPEIPLTRTGKFRFTMSEVSIR